MEGVNMSIGPIPVFGPLTSIELPAPAGELPPVARVDDSARVGKYSSGRRQNPPRQDGDADSSNSATDQEAALPEDASVADGEPGSQINLFA
jgi:hypothetical protein